MTMRTSGSIALLLALVLIAPLAHADIFLCVDADGHKTYSNIQTKNCKKLNLEPVNTTQGNKAATKTPTPSSFPKVDDGAQKARDNDRRRILEGELANEQKNLEQAKKELAEQEATILPEERFHNKSGHSGIAGGKVEARIQPYKDKVALHERNIEAIKKEISNLR